ncbi:MAG: SpoIIE family protein phosphatase [Sedimentisphaerales bacterium]|nr:SpoIIE family protein phosphatase [Sedimentisphaerales bacterium]
MRISIKGPDQAWQAELLAQGTLIGRSAKNDLVLDNAEVSRRHARIFRDPFQRWIIEDLGSRNGIFLNGRHIQAGAIMWGDQVQIGPYQLALMGQPEPSPPAPDILETTSTILQEDTEAQIVSDQTAVPESLSSVRLKELNEHVERLCRLTSWQVMYPELCRSLAAEPNSVAAVLRIPQMQQPLPASLDILAHQFGGPCRPEDSGDTNNLPISRRVMESVRQSRQPVMARSVHASEQDVTLTVIDIHHPRVVFAAPIHEADEAVEVLYLDLPMNRMPPDMFEFVRLLSRQVGLVRKSLLLMEAKARRAELDQQLKLAREIQDSLAPKIPRDIPQVDLALHYQPALWVGGDYCDVWPLPDGRLFFVVADVSGMGLPAALVMSNFHGLLHSTLAFCSDLARVVTHLNQQLLNNLPDNIFVTSFLGFFDPATGHLQYVNAGHLLPLVIYPGMKAKPLGTPQNTFLGAFDTSFTTSSEVIPDQAALLVFTDGIIEAHSPAEEEFGAKRVEGLFDRGSCASAESLVRQVVRAVEEFRRPLPQQDDITVFALRHRAS